MPNEITFRGRRQLAEPGRANTIGLTLGAPTPTVSWIGTPRSKAWHAPNEALGRLQEAEFLYESILVPTSSTPSSIP
jgi:hypothetical protein